MSAPPYMKLFWGDYLKATRHLTRGEHGAYLLLIAEAWRLGGHLPDDDKLLAKWALCTPQEWAEIKPVITEFFVLRRGRWAHDRVREELASYESTSRQAKLAGKKGGLARAEKQREISQADAKRTVSEPEPEPEPERKKDSLSSGDDQTRLFADEKYPPLFDAAWKAYPHVKGRSSKQISFGVWKKLSVAEREALPDACARFAKEAREPRGEFGAKAMERWLKAGLHREWLEAPKVTTLPVSAETIAHRKQHYRDTTEWRDAWGPLPDELKGMFG